MAKLYFMRHAASEANEKDILASTIDFPLSEQGKKDALQISKEFLADYKVERIISSPLKRAQQTAEPFAEALALNIEEDALLIEQHLGRYSGMTYAEIEVAEGYEHDRTQRWHWVPEGGGESYEMIAGRVTEFFAKPDLLEKDSLIVCHAVTLRLVQAVLEATLPNYPQRIAHNGEIWEVDFEGLGQSYTLTQHFLGDAKKVAHKA